MSAWIKNFENREILSQVRYLVLSNVNEDYPYYFCYMANLTYDNYHCCFYKELTFYGNRYATSLDHFQLEAVDWGTDVKYKRYSNSAVCSSISYSSINQDLQFTNVANNKSGLIDLIADTKFSSSGSSGGGVDFTPIFPYLYLISAILMLIFITNFIKSCFRRRS